MKVILVLLAGLSFASCKKDDPDPCKTCTQSIQWTVGGVPTGGYSFDFETCRPDTIPQRQEYSYVNANEDTVKSLAITNCR